ncbi:MAG TPA: chemotaxis protein CheA [Vicinamibacterales bacterium]|nr:chemotaxis protein CheA [Vicinamibacterales bacterium]
MSTGRKKPAKTPAVRIHDELATFAADPELAEMFVADGLDHLGTIEQTILKLEASPADLELVNDLFRPFHTIKGNAGVLGIHSVEAFAHKLETLLDLARSGLHSLQPEDIDLVLTAVDLLRLIVKELPARAAGHPVTDVTARSETLLAAVDKAIARGVVQPKTPVQERIDEPPDGAAPSLAEQSTVKVSTAKLDALVDMVGELVIAQAILAEDPALQRTSDERLSRQLAQVRRITTDIQRDAMSMRMVPIRRTFQKMVRLVRDLARNFDKPTEVVVSGEDTELDRKLVEQLTDPLMHMVRNTIDHGIETHDVRAAAGKAPTARIHLKAFHRAGGVVVEIGDDGAGLDTDRIAARAVAQGLVSDHTPMSADEVHQLIFRPGFSTADHVTEVSGRGVGMDVVRRNIEALRGRIEIHTERGRGTTFSLRLPLTLAIVDGLVLRVGRDRFVIPTPAVQESLRPRPEHVHTTHGRACMVQVRERLIPLLHLGEAFGIPGARDRISDGTVVIAEDNGRPVALVVDELLGKREVVIRSLGEMFRGVAGIAGGAILGDGRIGLILDTGGLLALAARTRSAVAV